jgi:hypothetical protein
MSNPPPSLPARLAKALAIILLCSLLGGIGLSVGLWLPFFTSKTYSTAYRDASKLVQSDTTASLKRRFLYGAASGAALGIVIACLLASDKPSPPAPPPDNP